MGTRCLTFVYEQGNVPLVNMYRQFDGYREGHGRDLANFLSSFDAIVNGYSMNETRKIANGMGCLAAQMIAHFKAGHGGIYLNPVDINDYGQDYEYHVYPTGVKVIGPGGGACFVGSWKSFNEWAFESQEIQA